MFPLGAIDSIGALVASVDSGTVSACGFLWTVPEVSILNVYQFHKECNFGL